MRKRVPSEESVPKPVRVGRYDLILELGQAALGPLWAARVASGAEEGRIVCVRRILVPTDRREVVSQLTEGTLAAMDVRHPKIMAVLDVTLAGSELCVVSEHIDGECLATLQRIARDKNSPFAPAMALRIALDLLIALDAARDVLREQARGGFARSLHGGLCPDSVFVAVYGDVLLADLGVSGAAGEFQEFIVHPELLPYRAPELLELGTKADERADVFSIGVLLWEMIAGRGLFADLERKPNPASLFAPNEASQSVRESIERALRAGPIERLDAMPSFGMRIGAAIANIVAKALERDPAARFQTLHQMRRAIEALPRDAVATPEQLSLMLDGMARTEVDSRRKIIDHFVRATLSDSAPPESTRPTKRPLPAAKPVSVAPKGGSAAPAFAALPMTSVPPAPAPLEYTVNEAPTSPSIFPKRDAEANGLDETAPVAVALKPSAIVSLGDPSPTPASAISERLTPDPRGLSEELLRAAFAAARKVELDESVRPPPSLSPVWTKPPPPPSSLPPAATAEVAVMSGRRHRARTLAIGIGALVAVVALIALARSLSQRDTGERAKSVAAEPIKPRTPPIPATSAPRTSTPEPSAAPPIADESGPSQAPSESSPSVSPAASDSAQAPEQGPKPSRSGGETQPKTYRPRGI